MKTRYLSPKEAYNIIAPKYDGWIWQRFWKNNEYPLIRKWCGKLPIGTGLDIGTGTGNNLDCFLQRGNRIDAIDISSEMLKLCIQKHANYIENGQLSCYEKDINQFWTEEKKYNWIISNRVFSHIEYLDVVIANLTKMLKYGGMCFFSDIHPQHDYKHTHMVIDDEDIVIKSYKHSIKELKSIFINNSFKIISLKEIRKEQLLDGGIMKDFPHSYRSDSPFFYYCILRYEGK